MKDITLPSPEMYAMSWKIPMTWKNSVRLWSRLDKAYPLQHMATFGDKIQAAEEDHVGMVLPLCFDKQQQQVPYVVPIMEAT